MTATLLDPPVLGEGIYTVPEASRILFRGGRPPRGRVRSWLSKGETFGLHATPEGIPVVTFLDLVSLETVRRLRGADLSLQAIRRAEHFLTDIHEVPRPFAHRFLTDGINLWLQHGDVTIEVVGKRPNHTVIEAAVRTFATEIEYGPEDVARRWRPHQYVELDPTVQFGAPVVRGTRITIETIRANLGAGTPRQVADWYGLTVDEVEGIAGYLSGD